MRPVLDPDGFGEPLISERHLDELWHAAYRTSDKTLCGRDREPQARGRRWPPDCGPCSKTARRFDQIDGSMPDHWRAA